MNYHRSLISILILTSLLAACGTIFTRSPNSLDTPTPSISSSTSITITDALDRVITFDSPPSRIVIVGRATALIAHSLYMFPEARDRLIGLENRLQRDRSFYQIVDPDFDKKTLLERDTGPEQILPLNPDAVILKSYLAETLGYPLERLGVPVVYVDLETPEQFQRDVSMLGTLLNNALRAEEILRYYDAQFQKIQSLIDASPVQKAPATLIIQYSDKGGEASFFVPSSNWLQTTLVELAGGQPVWQEADQGGGWTIVGFEQIAAWNPDKIFVIYYPDDPRSIVANLKESRNWQELNAVISGDIHAFAGDFISWDQPDPRWILGYIWLAKMIRPEATAEIDLLKETTLFYRHVYGLDEKTIATQILPLLPFIDS